MEKAIEILLVARPLDIMLSEMILDEYPTIIKEPSKKEEKIRRLEEELLEFLDTALYPDKIPEGWKNFILEQFENTLSSLGSRKQSDLGI